MADSKTADVTLEATCGTDLKNSLASARDRVASVLHDLNAKAEELGHCVTNKAKASVEKTETCIKDHPFASVGIALGVGLVVGVVAGLLINRSRQ